MICAAFTPVSLSHCASVLLHKHKTGPHKTTTKQTNRDGRAGEEGREGRQNKSPFLVSSAPNFLLGLENISPFPQIIDGFFCHTPKKPRIPPPIRASTGRTTPPDFAGPRHRLLSWQKLRRGKDPQLRP